MTGDFAVSGVLIKAAKRMSRFRLAGKIKRKRFLKDSTTACDAAKIGSWCALRG